jgi:type VI secretion system protein VasI
LTSQGLGAHDPWCRFPREEQRAGELELHLEGQMGKASPIVFAAFLLLAQFAQAQQPSPASLGACASVQGDLARLQCYDNLAQKMGLAPHSEAAAGKGEWKIDTETNPVDDSKTIILSVTAKNAKSRFGKPIALELRCLSGKTAAYIVWNEFLGDEHAAVTVRFGEEPATTQQWSVSTDKNSSFVPGDAIKFIKKLATVNHLVAQVTPYSESPVTAVFDTSALTDTVGLLATTCGWKL